MKQMNVGAAALAALKRMVAAHDRLSGDTEGRYPPLDAGCNDCTQGCTPLDKDTGKCSYHEARSVLRAAEWESGRGREPARELAILRVSLARVAQAAGVSLFAVGLADDAPYEVLYEAGLNRTAGWNELAATVCSRAATARRVQEGVHEAGKLALATLKEGEAQVDAAARKQCGCLPFEKCQWCWRGPKSDREVEAHGAAIRG